MTHLARGYVRWPSILATIALMPFTKSLAIGGRVRAWSCPINVKQVHSLVSEYLFHKSYGIVLKRLRELFLYNDGRPKETQLIHKPMRCVTLRVRRQ